MIIRLRPPSQKSLQRLFSTTCHVDSASTSMVFDRQMKRGQRDWAVRQPDFKAAQYLKVAWAWEKILETWPRKKMRWKLAATEILILFQEEIGWRVADKVFDLTKFNPLVLDIGCGVGHIAPHLIKENVGKIIQVRVLKNLISGKNRQNLNFDPNF